MRGLGNRLSFLAVPWVMLAGGGPWHEVGLVSAAQLAGYLAASYVPRRRSPGFYADIAAVMALGGIAFYHDQVIVLGVLAAVLGALCGVRGGAGDRGAAGSPPREGLILTLLLVAGLVAGAGAMWLGPLGALWVSALIFAVSAVAQLAPRAHEPAPIEPGARETGERETTPDGGDVPPLPRHPLVGRIAVHLFTANLLAQAAAVILVVVWFREVARAPELLGLMAAAFAVGMLGTHVRNLAVGAGALAGGAAVLLLGDRPPVLLLIVVAAFVAGAATASVDPLARRAESYRTGPDRPGDTASPAEMPLARFAVLGLPFGTAAAAWALGRVGVPVGLGIGAGLFLIALLIPVLAFRDWRQLLPDPPALPAGSARLPGRLTVTLVYTNGQWLVEIRKGRALLGSRHLVKSAEAMNMLALLEVPGVAETVEKALTGDKAEAARQAERVRNELSELESKLAGLHEMAELNDLRNTSDAPDRASAQ